MSSRISTRNLAPLPDIPTLKRLCQSIAMLEAVVMPDWESRYYSFNSKWAEGEMMASMRDGSGDDYFILFAPYGTGIKGYAHESPMAGSVVKEGRVWPGVLEEVSAEFADFLTEPAFTMDETTFCIWRRSSDTAWQVGRIDFPAGEDPDGSEELLVMLDGKPETYQAWAEEYYEREIPLEAIVPIYAHKPLTPQLVAAINPEITLEELREDIEEIGYP